MVHGSRCFFLDHNIYILIFILTNVRGFMHIKQDLYLSNMKNRDQTQPVQMNIDIHAQETHICLSRLTSGCQVLTIRMQLFNRFKVLKP